MCKALVAGREAPSKLVELLLVLCSEKGLLRIPVVSDYPQFDVPQEPEFEKKLSHLFRQGSAIICPRAGGSVIS